MAKPAPKSKSHIVTKADRRAIRQERRAQRRGATNVYDMQGGTIPLTSTARRNEGLNTRPMEYRSEAQHHYHQLILRNELTFGIGPAGTGKSHVAADEAALQLIKKEIARIIVTRPMVESGRGMGFLPGEVEDKFEPYFRPIRKILNKRLGASHVDNLIKNGQIEIAPLEFLRGDTFEDAFVILDEAQNTTESEMRTFLTRIGENCKVVVNGDMDQVDIKEPSGLHDAIRRLDGMDGSAIFEFELEDIIRSGIVREILKRYAKKN